MNTFRMMRLAKFLSRMIKITICIFDCNRAAALHCSPVCYFIYPPSMGETACWENSFRTPLGYLTDLGCQAAFLFNRISSISAGDFFCPQTPMISSFRLGISMRIRSSSSTSAIGPPSAASGETWPMAGPVEAPEKRPSVINATDFPRDLSEEMG